MIKYQAIINYPDGSIEESLLYNTEEEASEYGCYSCSCFKQGSEILHMSNPWENPMPDEEPDFDVYEVEV